MPLLARESSAQRNVAPSARLDEHLCPQRAPEQILADRFVVPRGRLDVTDQLLRFRAMFTSRSFPYNRAITNEWEPKWAHRERK